MASGSCCGSYLPATIDKRKGTGIPRAHYEVVKSVPIHITRTGNAKHMNFERVNTGHDEAADARFDARRLHCRTVDLTKYHISLREVVRRKTGAPRAYDHVRESVAIHVTCPRDAPT